MNINNLYKKLNKYSLEEIIIFEKFDRQFLALEKLYKKKIFSDENYLFLIIANALSCYQLSGRGEDYWEEFSNALINEQINNFEDVKMFFVKFLPTSKNNRRLVKVKLERIAKLKSFYFNLIANKNQTSDIQELNIWNKYYKNMDKLLCDLGSIMNQKIDAKTIVFAVKMFSYGARNTFHYIEYFPSNINIPLDSRLKKIYCKYNNADTPSKKEMSEFYRFLSKTLNIAPLHLDSLLWINYDKLI